MNYPDNSTVNTTAKKIRFSSASHALTVVMGLALLLPSVAALAADPIPGIDIIVQKKPSKTGDPIIVAPTGTDGAYQVKGLTAGNYDLSVGGKRVQTLRVGSDGGIRGVLSRQPDGTASITFNGRVGVVPDLPGERAAPGLPSSSSQAGIAKAGEAPLPGIAGGPYLTVELKEVLVSSKMADNNSPAPSNRGIGVAVGDVNGDGRRMGITVNPVNDAPGISDQGAAGGLISYATALPPKGGDKELPGLAGEPIPGVDVKLGKNPGRSIVASSKTDSTGAFHFDKLPAGNYELKVYGLPDQLITVGGDGIAGGKVMKGSDGSLSIFDRWGNRVASSPKDEGIKAAGAPFGFGSGNTPGVGPAGGGMGSGMRPGSGPAGGPISPGPGVDGGPMGGLGGAMRGAGAGRP